MLIDTDVIIWLFRGRSSARKLLEGLEDITLSAISYMELVQGMRNKEEFRLLRQTIHEQDWLIQPIDENISQRATVFIETYALSHGLQLADALIAASAVESGSTLISANTRHYRMIPEIDLKAYRP